MDHLQVTRMLRNACGLWTSSEGRPGFWGRLLGWTLHQSWSSSFRDSVTLMLLNTPLHCSEMFPYQWGTAQNSHEMKTNQKTEKFRKKYKVKAGQRKGVKKEESGKGWRPGGGRKVTGVLSRHQVTLYCSQHRLQSPAHEPTWPGGEQDHVCWKVLPVDDFDDVSHGHLEPGDKDTDAWETRKCKVVKHLEEKLLCNCAMMFKAEKLKFFSSTRIKTFQYRQMVILPFYNDAERRSRREMSQNDQGLTFSQLFIHLQTHACPSPRLWTAGRVAKGTDPEPAWINPPSPGTPLPRACKHLTFISNLKAKERQIIKGDPIMMSKMTHTYFNNQHNQKYLWKLKTFS